MQAIHNTKAVGAYHLRGLAQLVGTDADLVYLHRVGHGAGVEDVGHLAVEHDSLLIGEVDEEAAPLVVDLEALLGDIGHGIVEQSAEVVHVDGLAFEALQLVGMEAGGDGLNLGAGCHVAVGGVGKALAEGDVGQLGLHLADGAGGVELIGSVEVFALGGHVIHKFHYTLLPLYHPSKEMCKILYLSRQPLKFDDQLLQDLRHKKTVEKMPYKE